ncbi:hypothetical protein Rs2_40299 [Raphanus sativus]|nr:hypothetical protein Rs2_40299 [Raphanus sativus]
MGQAQTRSLMTTRDVDSTDTLQAHVFRSPTHGTRVTQSLHLLERRQPQGGSPDSPLKPSTSLDTPDQTGVHDLHRFFTATAFETGVYFIGELPSLLRDLTVTVRAHTPEQRPSERNITTFHQGASLFLLRNLLYRVSINTART